MRELGPYKRHELLTGEISYPTIGYQDTGTATAQTSLISLTTRCDPIGKPIARRF